MSTIRKCWSVGWRIGFCLLLLLWIFHKIFMYQGETAAQNANLDWAHMPRLDQWKMAWTEGPRDLWHTLCLIQPWALLVSALLFGFALYVCVIRWRIVLEAQGLHLPMGHATRISFVAQFFNSILLGSTGGDLIKAYYAARETHHKKTEAVTTVFVDRLVGLWAMLFFASVLMVPNYPLLRASRYFAVPSLIILGMLAVLSVVLGIAFWGGVSKRFPKARVYLRRLPKGDLLERSLDSCRQFGRQRAFLLKTVAISLFVNVVNVLQYVVLGMGLHLSIPAIALSCTVPVVLCISALPLTPSGLGVRENLFVLMLGVVGVPKTAALAVSLIASAQYLFWSLIGGLIYMGVREKDHLREVTRGDQEPNGN